MFRAIVKKVVSPVLYGFGMGLVTYHATARRSPAEQNVLIENMGDVEEAQYQLQKLNKMRDQPR